MSWPAAAMVVGATAVASAVAPASADASAMAPTAADGRSALGVARPLTAVSAYRGHVVWSHPAGGRQYLAEHVGGSTRRVPGSLQPADTNRVAAAVGPGPDGRVTTAFARCDEGGGCRLMLHPFGEPTSRRVTSVPAGLSIRAVALWGRRLVFSAADRTGIYRISAVDLRRGSPPRRIDVGTDRPYVRANPMGALDLALRGDRLLVSWLGPTCRREPLSVEVAELWLGRLGRPLRRVSQACPGSAGLNNIQSVSLGPRAGRVVNRSDATCVARLSYRGRVTRWTRVPGRLSALAQDRGGVYAYALGRRVYRGTTMPTSERPREACAPG